LPLLASLRLSEYKLCPSCKLVVIVINMSHHSHVLLAAIVDQSERYTLRYITQIMSHRHTPNVGISGQPVGEVANHSYHSNTVVN